MRNRTSQLRLTQIQELVLKIFLEIAVYNAVCQIHLLISQNPQTEYGKAEMDQLF